MMMERHIDGLYVSASGESDSKFQEACAYLGALSGEEVLELVPYLSDERPSRPTSQSAAIGGSLWTVGDACMVFIEQALKPDVRLGRKAWDGADVAYLADRKEFDAWYDRHRGQSFEELKKVVLSDEISWMKEHQRENSDYYRALVAIRDGQ